MRIAIWKCNPFKSNILFLSSVNLIVIVSILLISTILLCVSLFGVANIIPPLATFIGILLNMLLNVPLCVSNVPFETKLVLTYTPCIDPY